MLNKIFRNREMFPHLTNFSLVFFLFDLSMRHMDKNIRQSSFTFGLNKKELIQHMCVTLDMPNKA